MVSLSLAVAPSAARHREIRLALSAGSPPSMPHDPLAAMLGAMDEAEQVTVDRTEWDALLAVGTLYVNAFTEEEMMTLPEKLRLQEVEAILDKHGRRY
jgi:hypothetical protein